MMIIILFFKFYFRILLTVLLLPKSILYLIIGKKTSLNVHIVWLKPQFSAITKEDIEKSVAHLKEIFAQVGIEVKVHDIQIQAEVSTFGCNLKSVFQSGFSKIERNHLFDYKDITAYFVEDITEAGGCAFWGTSWCRIRPACTYDSTILAHEIGHLLNLPHSFSSKNVMYAHHGGETNQLNVLQKFLMLCSPYLG